MEIKRFLKLFSGNYKSYALSYLILTKVNNLFFWKVGGVYLRENDCFIRWNDIIRPISKSPDGDLIRFFDKDLSEDSTDELYIQENVDSHLE